MKFNIIVFAIWFAFGLYFAPVYLSDSSVSINDWPLFESLMSTLQTEAAG